MLSDEGGTIGFYKYVGTTIDANRVYVTTNGGASLLKLDFNGISTGINSATITSQDSCYDLQGRRVEHPTKGMYIVNGKKVIK